MEKYFKLKSSEVKELTHLDVKKGGFEIVDSFYYRDCLVVDMVKAGQLYRGVFVTKPWKFEGMSNSEIGRVMDSCIDRVKELGDAGKVFLYLSDSFIPFYVIRKLNGDNYSSVNGLSDAFKLKKSSLNDAVTDLFKPSVYENPFSSGSKVLKVTPARYGVIIEYEKNDKTKKVYFVLKAILGAGKRMGAHSVGIKKFANLLNKYAKEDNKEAGKKLLKENFVGYYDIRGILSAITNSIKKNKR